jgi:hypothetical protein
MTFLSQSTNPYLLTMVSQPSIFEGTGVGGRVLDSRFA